MSLENEADKCYDYDLANENIITNKVKVKTSKWDNFDKTFQGISQWTFSSNI